VPVTTTQEVVIPGATVFDDEAESLLDALAEARSESADLISRITDAEQREAATRHDAEEATRLLETVQATLRGAEEENTRLRGTAARDAKVAKAELDGRDGTILVLRAKLAAAEGEKNQLAGATKLVLDGLRQHEFSGKSAKFTYKNTRKSISCCPVCAGLTSAGMNPTDKDVGHKANCWLGSAVKALTLVAR
jgi:hypothetical protein